MVNHELRNSLAAVFGWAEMLVRKKDPATVPARGLRGARLGPAGDRTHQRPARPEPAGRGPAPPGDPGGGSRGDRAAGLEPHDAHRRGEGGPASSRWPRPAGLRDRREPGGADSGQPDGQRHPALAPGRRRCGLQVSARDRDGRASRSRTTGPGIPADEVERIFDIYVTKKQGDAQGVGLGLPLSRRLARLLGRGAPGGIPGQDRGGRFVLELPAAPPS